MILLLFNSRKEALTTSGSKGFGDDFKQIIKVTVFNMRRLMVVGIQDHLKVEVVDCIEYGYRLKKVRKAKKLQESACELLDKESAHH